MKNTCYGYQDLRSRCRWQGERPGGVFSVFINHLWTAQEGLRCVVRYRQLHLYINQFMWHKHRVNNTANLRSYLRFFDNIMCIVGPNNSFGYLTQAIRMDDNGCDMRNDGKFDLFWTMGGHMGATWRIKGFAVMVILEKPNHCLCLPAEQ